MEPPIQKHHHHILPNKTAILIGGTLLFLTAVTVWVAQIDLGPLNFLIAFAVASFKATLVALFFMNLKYDRKENAVIFATSFVFLAIFLVLTSTDLFFRGDVYSSGPIAPAAAQGGSKLKNPWIATPELIARGKKLYAEQCVTCHGDQGAGNGPAASALNPPPRNFHQTTGWKNGRKATLVFKTLKEGLPPSAMASYSTLPTDDRWALSHFVLTFGPKPAEDTPADFAAAGVDPKGGGVEKVEPTISVELAMERMAVPERPMAEQNSPRVVSDLQASMPGHTLYQNQCASCHGSTGKGGKVQNLGVNPVAYVNAAAFSKDQPSLRTEAEFNRWVTQGLPGRLMPAYAELTDSELHDLYVYVRELAD